MKNAPTPQGRRLKDQRRVPLSMRITPQVREELERASERSGRSLTQEAEFRLESSFRDQNNLIETLKISYGQELGALLLLIGRSLRTISDVSHFHLSDPGDGSTTWLDNSLAYAAAVQAISRYLEALRPRELANQEFDSIAARLASLAESDLHSISAPPAEGTLGAHPWNAPFYTLIRELLGAERSARIAENLAAGSKQDQGEKR